VLRMFNIEERIAEVRARHRGLIAASTRDSAVRFRFHNPLCARFYTLRCTNVTRMRRCCFRIVSLP
ncbi:hypothetical protein L9F63_001157, partial [Diploptera punctata]